MLIPERMRRVRFLVHDSFQETFLRQLHELGCVQVTGRREAVTNQELEELLSPQQTPLETKTISSLLVKANRILETFRSVLPLDEPSFFNKLFFSQKTNSSSASSRTSSIGERSSPDVTKDFSSNLLEITQEAEPLINEAEKLLSEPLLRLEEAERDIALLQKHQKELEKIKNIQLPLELLGQGAFAGTICGFVVKDDCRKLSEILKEGVGTNLEITQFVFEKHHCFILISCLQENRDECVTLAKRNGLEIFTSGDYTGTPREALQKIEEKLTELKTEDEKAKDTIKDIAVNWYEDLECLEQQLKIRQERLQLLASVSSTSSVTFLEGWTPVDGQKQLEKNITDSSGGLVAAFFSEPDVPVEKIPVKLKNPGFFKHFEPLTKLYALPRYDELDPTILLTCTALFFFGLMITDALYGLLTLVLGLLILRGGGQNDPMFRSSGIMLSLAGGSAVLLGMLAGGWFGNLGIEHLGLKSLETIVLIDPMKEVSDFLVFAILVGLVHINFGIVLGIIKEIRRGEPKNALNHVWIFFFEAALIANYFEEQAVLWVFLLPGILLLLYRAKGMAFFAVTGFIGDSLSYARLMALGLVSFGLAFSINALAMLVWDLGSLGWIAGIGILVIGHLFSWLLNVIGAFAHALRLHFVEFFGKFYEGGGVEFEPFKMSEYRISNKE